MAGEWRSRQLTSTHFTDQPIEYFESHWYLVVCAILIPAVTSRTHSYHNSHIPILGINPLQDSWLCVVEPPFGLRLHMWSNSWVCFFGAFLQWMSGFGLVACACSVVDLRIMLDEHPITARKSSEFTFGWEKKGKDLKDPMFIQVLDSFIVCYITRIYHPGENPEPAYIVWECLWNTVG